MAARKSPAEGRKSDKLIRNALMVAINREAKDADGQPTKKLALIAEKLVELAVEGDVQAIKEIGDRIDGKPTQAIASDPENPFEVAFIGLKESLGAKLDRVAGRKPDSDNQG